MIRKIAKISKWMIAAILIYVVISVIIYPFLCIHVTKESKKQSNYIPMKPVKNASVLCIDDNMDALVWRLKVIESAREELILTTFDFGDDNSGKDIMAALLAAADRGVKVRMIVDGMNAQLKLKKSDSFRALASNENVAVKFYNPINVAKLWKVNYRMHDKYLIADDSVYLLGGRNTNALFLGNYREHYNIDRDMLVYEEDSRNQEFSTLMQLKDYFNVLWKQRYCKDFRYEKEEKNVLAKLAELQNRYHVLKEDYMKDFKDTEFKIETQEVESLALISNSMECKSKVPYVWNAICREMASGKDILIQTPYIICDKFMYSGLSKITEAGNRVDIITNAVASGANPWGCTDYLNQKKRILSSGVSVYECLAGQSLHTKTILIRDDISIVGSFNLDARSTYLDTEMMLVVKSKEQNQSLRESAKLYKARSLAVSPEGEEVEQRDYVKKILPWRKNLFYGILRIVVMPVRHLL